MLMIMSWVERPRSRGYRRSLALSKLLRNALEAGALTRGVSVVDTCIGHILWSGRGRGGHVVVRVVSSRRVIKWIIIQATSVLTTWPH